MKQTFLNGVAGRIALGTLTAALLCAPAVAQNLVPNGTFDHDISGWSTSDSTVKFAFRGDAGSTLPGGSGPGSLEVQQFFWNGGSGGPHTDDIQVTAGTTYTLSGAAFLPDSTDNVADDVDLYLSWRNADGYETAREWVGIYPIEKGKWLTAAKDLVAPSGAVAVRIWAVVGNPVLENETRPGVAYFDDIVFVEKGATAARQVLFVPASASAHGRNGTLWTTTGWFANAVAYPVEIKAAFLRQGQDNGSAVGQLTSLGTVPANGYLEVKDMAAKIGGAGLTGGIYIEATAQAANLPATLVHLITYTFTPNPGGSGGYGQGVPAVDPGTKNDVTIPGVYQNAAYRTNIGVLNTSASTVEIRVTITGADGKVLGTATWTLKPYEQKQVSVTDLGVNDASGGFVTFTRSGSAGSFRAYATVVDQHTGDAVYTGGM
ncbi:MAG TPA: hypothetical protein ENK19_05435 [Acidobacteria bacterium]|nr:hypothetical protein [Acidobacteriota bacterium]